MSLPPGAVLNQDLLDDIGDELNVKHLQPLNAESGVIDVQLKANFRELGKRFGRRTPRVAAAITGAEPRALVDRLRAGCSVDLEVDGELVSVGADDVLVTEVPRTGWVVESHNGVTLALDTEITPELAEEGVARDVVRVVQQARREAELAVTDRIALSLVGPPDVLAAVRAREEFVINETLAVSVTLTRSLSEGFAGIVGDNRDIVVHVARARPSV